jgi:RNA polymerase sigma-70 factor (ECF subfamily)
LINENSSSRDSATSDEILVARSKKGDKAAFEILVKRYSKYVYTTAFFMVRDSHEAEDISQEVFVKVYLAIGGFRGLSSFKTWLRKLTVNTCIDKIRVRSKTSDKKVSLDSMIEDGKEILLYEFNQNVEKFFQDKETVNNVLKIIVNLEESYRIPLILRDLQDYSYIEIAEILKKPVGTIKTNIHRARKIIKDLLAGK